jgi:ABC-type glycerol-3-phosphate transport system substrate-binding protein
MKLRPTVCAAALTLVAVGLTACSSNSKSNDSTGRSSPATSVTASSDSPASQSSSDIAGGKVVVWIRADSDASAISAFLEDWANLEDWAKTNKVNIDVEKQPQPSYQQALQIGLKTGKGPDVFFVGGGPKLMRAGLMAPLDDVGLKLAGQGSFAQRFRARQDRHVLVRLGRHDDADE